MLGDVETFGEKRLRDSWFERSMGGWGLFCGRYGKSVPLAYQPVNRFAAGSGIGRRYSTDRYSFPTTPFMGHFDGWPTTQPMDIPSE